MDFLTIVLYIVLIIGFIVFLRFFPFMLWIAALASGVRIGIVTLIAMRLRRVIPNRIVNPMIQATKAGLG
ncbi:MAG: flotillin-like FloA family protein, partial [Paenibacillaceae bacterium]|nr:flotillin-like FloA family protein [Paenibacillaceae bacterium]